MNSASMNKEPWPTELKLKKSANTLTITFDDGKVLTLSAKNLRENSPSAEVQGHGGQKPEVNINPNVRITGVEAVGNYAVRILFDDGHATGLYSWAWLYHLKAG
ncbi:MAG: gamma-butyrobetaine hydroxylase-like domain-containing protein [Alphaproteobacteria bacterium]|nr:gamma-butyrobetaine hydroxylase-like domain-containing protein [Alphaproteobacteria bacterium]